MNDGNQMNDDKCFHHHEKLYNIGIDRQNEIPFSQNTSPNYQFQSFIYLTRHPSYTTINHNGTNYKSRRNKLHN